MNQLLSAIATRLPLLLLRLNDKRAKQKVSGVTFNADVQGEMNGVYVSFANLPEAPFQKKIPRKRKRNRRKKNIGSGLFLLPEVFVRGTSRAVQTHFVPSRYKEKWKKWKRENSGTTRFLQPAVLEIKFFSSEFYLKTFIVWRNYICSILYYYIHIPYIHILSDIRSDTII